MSEAYIERLRAIQHEFFALRFTLNYVNRYWDRKDIFIQTNQTTPQHLKTAETNLEKTYIIRLFSEFEGILHEHLVSGGHSVPAKPSAEWLISEVNRRNKSVLHPKLISKVRSVQAYRNSLVHPRTSGSKQEPLQDVLAHLNRYLAKL